MGVLSGFKHKCILVNIPKSVDIAKNLYDSTRFAWRMSKERAENAEFVLGVYHNIIVGVFEPESWYRCSKLNEKYFPEGDKYETGGEKRILFIGKEADVSIKEYYINQEIPGEFYFYQNPVRYTY